MRTEKILTIIFIVGLISKVLHWSGAEQLLAISLFTLAILYFPTAFYFFCDKVIKRQNLVLSIVSGLFLALVPLGVLFKIMYWSGGQTYLSVGVVTSLIILAVIYFLKSKTSEDLKIYYENMFLRTSVLTCLAIIFYLTSTSTLLKIQYWDDPELARLKTLHYTDPINQEYKKQHDDYLSRRDTLNLDRTNQ
jgi:hypothetical protein